MNRGLKLLAAALVLAGSLTAASEVSARPYDHHGWRHHHQHVVCVWRHHHRVCWRR